MTDIDIQRTIEEIESKKAIVAERIARLREKKLAKRRAAHGK